MQHPYHCLVPITAQGDGAKSLLLLACGSNLILASTMNGSIISMWTSDPGVLLATEPGSGGGDEDGRRKKRQRIGTKSGASPRIVKLAVSPHGQHAVAVTDDKCLRVFDIKNDVLTEVSQRTMPKRPCAVKILPDNATILSADKFGDVYSLPLLPSEPDSSHAASGEDPFPETQKAAFKPSATNLTVHTKRNRKALEAQLKQKSFTAKKEALKYATREVDGRERSYIITADRDEHIRVSRGLPHTHVIEGYCLGHSEYVSKLCLVPGTDLLVSGGGDDWLGVWNWTTFALRHKLQLPRGAIASYAASTSAVASERTVDDAKDTLAINVSGLWTVPYMDSSGNHEIAVAVGCERTPLLFLVRSSSLQSSEADSLLFTKLELPAPPLDVVCSENSVIISIDNRQSESERLKAYKISEDDVGLGYQLRIEPDAAWNTRLKCLNDAEQEQHCDDESVDELLYSVATLRKRRAWSSKQGEYGDEDPTNDLTEAGDDIAE
ncbi:hypothetical protein BAUCODRAFT_534420 [Baudoinia panamericana UAMH 10762]|uniref:Uncharacterized protein n=1 Tax=Baudoinia panamericana (strain UAMH 10762) TaxID=717646 RepID=M2N8X9_BAUPA|nr:uncharacterized protein BAUCODRAFT_534420 [Baudoinia panamericana UAMH 10762]EMC95290.1 hypothetical protein BAUCODRAFT_534420 [Baudoinia panamericana UAMH 10762]